MLTRKRTCRSASVAVAVPMESGDGETISGGALVAEALKQQGVQWVFGVVGIPVTNIAPALQDAGIGYIGMRNEQAVSYLCTHSAQYVASRSRELRRQMCYAHPTC